MRLLLVLTALAACGDDAAAPFDAGSGGGGGEPAPLPPEELPVTFPAADGLELEGTLHLPARGAGTRVPGVILVHGSGPTSRDAVVDGQLGLGFGFRLRIFEELAEALQGAGFAVLRYDKRTCGRFNGCARNNYPLPELATLVIDVHVDDAVAALDHLAARPDIGALHVIGHSEGAQLTPAIATAREAVRSAVMLAGPHRTIAEIWAYQNDKLAELLALVGLSPAEIAAELAAGEAVEAQLLALAQGTFAGEEIDGLPAAYWASWIAAGEAAPGLARALDRPLFALSGAYDWNVPPTETEAWADTFRGTPHEATVLPCITHALNCITEPDPLRIRPDDIEARVSPALIDEVIAFLSR